MIVVATHFKVNKPIGLIKFSEDFQQNDYVVMSETVSMFDFFLNVTLNLGNYLSLIYRNIKNRHLCNCDNDLRFLLIKKMNY